MWLRNCCSHIWTRWEAEDNVWVWDNAVEVKLSLWVVFLKHSNLYKNQVPWADFIFSVYAFMPLRLPRLDFKDVEVITFPLQLHGIILEEDM